MKKKHLLKILIAEDNYLISRHAQKVLEILGHEVIGIAGNGEEACTMAAELKPDLILMDITMPKMTGIEATAIIQEKSPTAIVILTAHESIEFLYEATEAGVGAFLIKPVQVPLLERAITIASARHQDYMKLKNALDEVKTLRELIPICCKCKKIRDDSGYWHNLETYISKHAGVKFSHGYCTVCAKEATLELQQYKEEMIDGNQ